MCTLARSNAEREFPIPLVLDDICDDSNLNTDLKEYLENHTFIDCTKEVRNHLILKIYC